jgi:ATPase subunit of ABC transporter with duplicated ATPase domains
LREAASRGRHGRADTRAGAPALLDYPGCAVVISRDRWFLDRIATHIQVASATGNP